MKTLQIKWIYLTALALIWGSSFILIKKGLIGLTAIQVGALRIVFAALFLLLIGFKSLAKIPQHHWKHITLTAILGTFLPAVAVLFFSDFYQVMKIEKAQYSMLYILVLGVIGTGIANIIFFKTI